MGRAFILKHDDVPHDVLGVSNLTKPTDLLVPIIVSVIAVVGWVIFILLHAAFWSEAFSLFQNIVIGVVTFLVAIGVAGLSWVIWVLRQA